MFLGDGKWGGQRGWAFAMYVFGRVKCKMQPMAGDSETKNSVHPSFVLFFGTQAHLHLLNQAETKCDLELLSMCAPNFSPSPLWKVTHCPDWSHLTSKSNFRIRLLLGCLHAAHLHAQCA